MNKYIVILLSLLVTACKTTGSLTSQSIGNFVFAGPLTTKKDDIKTVRWSYGMEFSINVETITQIRFSCDPIPETSFVVNASDIKPIEKNAFFFDGEERPLVKEKIPWLFDPKTTNAECKAIVSRNNLEDVTITAPVKFTKDMKLITILQ